MGILKSYIHLFCMEQKRNAIIKGDLLTLGQQAIFSSLADVQKILAFHELPIRELPPGFDTANKIPSWEGTSYGSNPNAQTLFTLLGADRVYATDLAPYENPDFMIDLNEPVDISYHERFDTIVDVGTLEHVFDIPTALKNIVRMCRRGGSVILINPCSGSIDHGFYQFSPTLYFDYFSANGFAVVGCYLDEPLRYSPLDKRKGRIFKYEYVDGEHPIVSSTGIDLVFFATRKIIGEADGSHKPNQSLWKNVWASSLEKANRATASPSRKVSLSPLHEGVTTGNTPWERLRQGAKRAWVAAGVPIPRNESMRLILGLSFMTAARRFKESLVDPANAWHPLWLHRYLFNKGRGTNIRYMGRYSASGGIRLRRSSRPDDGSSASQDGSAGGKPVRTC